VNKGENPLIRRIPVKDRDGKVIGEKEVVSYRGLLDMVHKERLQSIETKLLQAPSKENGESAIVLATITTSRGVFTGIGDANPRNVNPKVAPHAIRMAETRAEARAMRKAVNIGVVAIEELGEDLSDDVTYEGTLRPANSGNGKSERPTPGPGPVQAPPTRSSDTRASEQQRRYLFRLLASQGIEGDGAREFIHRELGVSSLQDASRAAVSALIDKVQAGAGANGGTQPAKAG
jgi:hypothetical protein